MNKKLMFLPLTKSIFKSIFDIKSEDIDSVLEQYNTDQQSLYDALWEEFNIPSMEIRIANTAFDYLICCCQEKKDLCETLKGEIKKNILASSVFYTNIAPYAAHTSDFKIKEE